MKTRSDDFVAGQEVWRWDGISLERRQVQSPLDWHRGAYRLVKTSAYSEDVTIGRYLYAYPQDREVLIDAMEEYVSDVQYKIRQLREQAVS